MGLNPWTTLDLCIKKIDELGVDALRLACETIILKLDNKDLRRLTNACIAEERRRQDEPNSADH
jgi:hypothetical protein